MNSVSLAHAILQVANANMNDALRPSLIQQGYDPRDFAPVAFGGASPLYAVDLIRHDLTKTVRDESSYERSPHDESRRGR